MTIPKILDDLFDYETYDSRNDGSPTYIWAKKGKQEEVWAICSLLGMIVDREFKVAGHPATVIYTFIPAQGSDRFFVVGTGARFNYRDLVAYFKQWETDNAT